MFEPATGAVLLRVVGTGEACGFDIPLGGGRAIVLTAAYNCDVPLFRALLETLGARAALRHDAPQHGIFMTTSAGPDGERFLHLLNLDGFDKTIHLTENGQALLGGRAFTLRRRDGVMLPLNITCGAGRIVYATAEITQLAADAITFRLTQDADVIVLETDRTVTPSTDYSVARNGRTTTITSGKHALLDNQLTVRWK